MASAEASRVLRCIFYTSLSSCLSPAGGVVFGGGVKAAYSDKLPGPGILAADDAGYMAYFPEKSKKKYLGLQAYRVRAMISFITSLEPP